MTHSQKQCLACSKMCSRCGKINHYKAVCRSAQKLRYSQKVARNKAVHEIKCEEEPYTGEHRDDSRDIVSVNIKYLNCNRITSVIFTKSETSKAKNGIMYKIDIRSDGNIMPFRVFKTLLLKSTTAKLSTTKIPPLWYVMYVYCKMRHIDKYVKCRTFAVQAMVKHCCNT